MNGRCYQFLKVSSGWIRNVGYVKSLLNRNLLTWDLGEEKESYVITIYGKSKSLC